MTKNKAYYVVYIGRQPGIYTSWPECEAQVKGYICGVQQGFATEQEALDAWRYFNEHGNVKQP